MPKVEGGPQAPSPLCFADALHDDFGGIRELPGSVAILV